MKEQEMLKLFDKFLKENKQGKRVQKDRQRLRSDSIRPYFFLRKRLHDFSVKKNFHLRVRNVSHLKKRELNEEKKYWRAFYLGFTNFLYDDLGCFDNYVGAHIKRLRTFFNYLNDEKGLNIGNFHKQFYACSEQIEIITLLPEQLNFLIYDKEFEERLPVHLKRTKDMFVFGCTVALRVSDIFSLTRNNLETINGKYYLRVNSKKTNTFTRVVLPDYAIKIINKQPANRKTVFSKISNVRFNINIKSLMELTNWTSTYMKTRMRRGVPVEIYKDVKNKTPFRFCDLITSHTMRKTAITTMLCLGMSENAVRKVSGHAAGSKEFFRYVQLSQFYMDTEAEKVFSELKFRTLKHELV